MQCKNHRTYCKVRLHTLGCILNRYPVEVRVEVINIGQNSLREESITFSRPICLRDRGEECDLFSRVTIPDLRRVEAQLCCFFFFPLTQVRIEARTLAHHYLSLTYAVGHEEPEQPAEKLLVPPPPAASSWQKRLDNTRHPHDFCGLGGRRRRERQESRTKVSLEVSFLRSQHYANVFPLMMTAEVCFFSSEQSRKEVFALPEEPTCLSLLCQQESSSNFHACALKFIGGNCLQWLWVGW